LPLEGVDLRKHSPGDMSQLLAHRRENHAPRGALE
jgi:hypothetical protein